MGSWLLGLPGWSCLVPSDSPAPRTEIKSQTRLRKGRKAERPRLRSHLSPRHPTGVRSTSSTIGYRGWGDSGGGRPGGSASHASVWLVPSSAERQQNAKTFTYTWRTCTPAEALESGETGSGGAGSQPRGQNFQEGGLSCVAGMEGSWGSASCTWPFLGRALGSVG